MIRRTSNSVRRGVRLRVQPPVAHSPVRAHSSYLLLGFFALIAAGTLLLWLPMASRAEGAAPFMTALFTATSAVCVTGLVVVDTNDYWSPMGQATILALIHLGGLGFMTSSTLLFILAGRRLSLRQRLLVGDTLGRTDTTDVGQLVRRIVLFSVSIEATGVLLLFVLDGQLSGRALWRATFTAISGFNNAGMDVEGGFSSLIARRDDEATVIVVMALVMLGGLGYAVLADLSLRRSWQRLQVETKIVLVSSVVLWAGGALAFLILEHPWNRELAGNDVLDASAMSVFARTAGFSVVNPASLEPATLFMLAGLMFVGGASASTAGGIKLSTLSTLVATVGAALRGHERVTLFEREIASRHVYRALSVALLSLAVVFLLTFTLATIEGLPFLDLMYEAVSAFGTVGSSTGITPELSTAGQLALIVGMYIGRLGPLTVALALLQRSQMEPLRYPTEEISIG
ncbi:MAG: TrkH family potassium uptake protein [Dehalococcoidia bacterium]